MWKITNISESFFFEDWNIKGYFEMLGDRFLHLRGIFLREFGQNGNWIFWGLIFFLVVIFCIYIKLLAEMLKKSDEVLSEEIEEYDEHQMETGDEQYADEAGNMPDEETMSGNAGNIDIAAVYEETDITDENVQQVEYIEKKSAENEDIYEMILENMDKEEEEMEKRLSMDIVQKSKTSDDYLNLKEVLFKQSKNNNDKQAETKTEKSAETRAGKSAVSKPEKPAKVPSLNDEIWDLDRTVGVIVNMLARKVSDKKIAQSVNYLNKGADDAEEIIQLVKAVKNFVGYCNTGKFAQLPGRANLPTCEDSLYSLTMGDNKQCMELMETLLNTQVSLAQRQKGLSKELSYALAADYACTMGTLANLNNYELAINSFELAVELAPKNVNALSRCADLYWQDNNTAKAAEVYQQVLTLADDVIYPEQKANANVKLAQYYRVSGKMFKADEMEKEGRKFFDEYGVKNPLSDMEKNTIQVLLSDQRENMYKYIKELLNI